MRDGLNSRNFPGNHIGGRKEVIWEREPKPGNWGLRVGGVCGAILNDSRFYGNQIRERLMMSRGLEMGGMAEIS